MSVGHNLKLNNWHGALMQPVVDRQLQLSVLRPAATVPVGKTRTGRTGSASPACGCSVGTVDVQFAWNDATTMPWRMPVTRWTWSAQMAHGHAGQRQHQAQRQTSWWPTWSTTLKLPENILPRSACWFRILKTDQMVGKNRYDRGAIARSCSNCYGNRTGRFQVPGSCPAA